jgi:hypothetical protein
MPAKSTKRKSPRKQPSTRTSPPGSTKTPVASRPILPAKYGVNTSRKGLLDWSWARERMTNSENYVIVTVRPDGRPHAMGMHGLWHDEAFYFGTGQTTRKARNLAQNPHCIVISERLDELVIVEGTADTVPFADLPKGLSELSHKKYGWPIDPRLANSLFRVTPNKVFGIPLKQFATAFTRWNFA